jgi:SAM-dependent methyltransferase
VKKREYEVLYEVEDVHWWSLGHRYLYASLLDRYCPEAARGNVLDAGCGTGGFTQWIRGRYDPERIVGLDMSDDALARCRDRGLVELMCCPVERIPLPDDSFDLVLSLNVLYHREVTDDVGALREMRRVIAPGGYLLLNLPAFSFLRGSHDEAVDGIRRYNAHDTLEKLALAGLKPVKITYFVFTLFPFIAAFRLLSRVWAKEDPVSDLWLPPAPVNRALKSLLALEARVAVAHGLPMGTSITALARKA